MQKILLCLTVVASLVVLGTMRKGHSDESVERSTCSADWRQATFIKQDGDPFELSSLIGKPTVLSFVFTCCKAYCPAQMSDLTFLQKTLDREFGSDNYQFLTVSMAPKHDTPEKLKVFADRFGGDYKNWHVVVGDKIATDALIEEAGLRLVDFSTEKCADFDHSTDLYIIDSNGQFHSKVAGLPLDDAEVVAAIREINDVQQKSARE